MKTWLKIVIAAAAVLLIGAAVCLIIFIPKENDPKMIEQMDIEKYASPSLTVSEGGEITYTVKITSRAKKSAKLLIEDTLPENSTLVSGDFTAEGNALSAKVTVQAEETKALSYTVRLGDSYKNGMWVKSPAAVIGEKQINGCENYVIRTLEGSEKARMRDAIDALMYSENIASIKLVMDMYRVAFSEAPKITETLSPEQILDKAFSEAADPDTEIANIRAMAVPALFGGSEVSDTVKSKFIGIGKIPKVSDFVIGDILFVDHDNKTNVYIFDGEHLVSVMNGCSVADEKVVLSDVEKSARFIALRPSLSMEILAYEMQEQALQLTDAQKALIATAKAYLQRGYRTQYDDSRMPNSLSGNYSGEYRWQLGQYNPEDYTEQKWGYLNCAAFTYECYRTALGLDLGSRYTTRNLAAHYTNGGEIGVSEYPYFYNHNSLSVPEADRAAEQEKFMNTLEVGDLVVIIRKGGYGHVMMYIGNGVLIHSSGASFTYGKDQETYEPTIRYMNVLGYLFNPASTNYLFREVEDADTGALRPYIYSLSIVRPLDRFESEGMKIPENTLNRMQNLEGIYSEKLSSHPEGKTANVGDKITFTFRIKNLGLTEKTLTVEEILPVGAKLDSAGNFTESNGKLTASVTVKPGKTKEISYSVIVNGAAGTAVISPKSTVGGVLHTCPAIKIAETLTQEKQQALLSAVAKYKQSNPNRLTGFELANAIYEEAGLEVPFSENNLHSSLFNKKIYDLVKVCYELNQESEYYSMVVPTMYGGLRFFTPQRYTATSKPNTDRSRLPRKQGLVIGDLVIAKFSSAEVIYMYTGEDHLLNLSSSVLADDIYSTDVRLMRMMSSGNYYTILRPSMG